MPEQVSVPAARWALMLAAVGDCAIAQVFRGSVLTFRADLAPIGGVA